MDFFTFIGSDVNEASALLEQHKVQLAEMKSTSECHSSQEQRNTAIALQNPSFFESSVHHKQQHYNFGYRALNGKGAQAQSNNQYVRAESHSRQ